MPTEPGALLADLRVVELATNIAGPYAGKLFADMGADVIKVEPAGGDPLRRRRQAPGSGTGPLFRYLNAGKRSVVATTGEELLSDADVVITTATAPGVPEGLLERHPGLVVLSITPYGLRGSWRLRPATEFTLQADSGGTAFHGRIDQVPFQVGGRTVEWGAGTFGAVAALAATFRSRRSGVGDLVDCSLQACATFTLTSFIDTRYSMLGRPELQTPPRIIEVPSIEPTADGWVGFNTNTRQQFDDFLVMIERPDLLAEPAWASADHRAEHMDEWNAIVREWTTQQKTEDIVTLATLLRIPVAPVNDAAGLLGHAHFAERGVFVPSADHEFIEPLPPYQFDGRRVPRGRLAPALGEHDGARFEPRPPRTAVATEGRVFDGLRVLDATAFWAGPSVGQFFALHGAEVIHLESIQRLDGGRTIVPRELADTEQWWERGSMWLSTNHNKRDVTIDLGAPAGRELVTRLIAECDVVVENFSPRVFETFGFGRDEVRRINPRVVFVRMPAFGLDGPWRDNVGFAQTMEQMSGMAWVTGHPDDQPRIPRGPCDPSAGYHALFAALAALKRRDETGEGCFVEVAMVEAALNIAAELVVEHTGSGTSLEREGNRSVDAAPQGVYPCKGIDSWLALAVETDEQWASLRAVLGNPPWADEARFATHELRRLAQDELDRHLATWAASCLSEVAAEQLSAAGVPAAELADPRSISTHPQLLEFGYFEEVDHPVVGRNPLPTVPFRLASIDRWVTSPPPTLGQHNREVLGKVLGLDDATIDQLEADGVIGTRPAHL